jgi:pimeloyl-ACP methyl ester carboxylesterase
MDRRGFLNAAVRPLVMPSASNILQSKAFAETGQRGKAMDEPTQRNIEANDIRINIPVQGSGPLVVLCHGFPECWYSRRHQLPALAAAGFHAVAPHMRGYGKSLIRP